MKLPVLNGTFKRMRNNIFLATLISFAVAAATANAAVLFSFVLDPATTAGGGSMSTQFGAASWHLFAIDLNEDSLGISSYSVHLNDVTTVLHKTPAAQVLVGDNIETAGVSLLRSANNSSSIHASQNLPGLTPFQIAGLGQHAGDFSSQVAAIDSNATILPNGLPTSWGNYDAAPAPINDRQWLFLAEGTYADGILPTIGSSGVTVFNTDGEFRSRFSDVCLEWPCAPPAEPEPPVEPPVSPPPPDHPMPPLETPQQPGLPEPPPVEVIVVDPPDENPPASDPWPDVPPIDEPSDDGSIGDDDSAPDGQPSIWIPETDPIPLPYTPPDFPILRPGYWVDTGEGVIRVFPAILDVVNMPWHHALDGQPAIQHFSHSTSSGGFLLYASALAGDGSMFAAVADTSVPEPTSALLAGFALLAGSLACGRRRDDVGRTLVVGWTLVRP